MGWGEGEGGGGVVDGIRGMVLWMGQMGGVVLWDGGNGRNSAEVGGGMGWDRVVC